MILISYLLPISTEGKLNFLPHLSKNSLVVNMFESSTNFPKLSRNMSDSKLTRLTMTDLEKI